MKKRILAILMATMIAITLLPGTVWAVDDGGSGKCGSNVYWSFDSATGTLEISGTGKMNDYLLNSSKGRSPWYEKYHDKIYNIVIQDGITSIGNYSFIYCSNVTRIALPDSITEIGDGAFDACWGLSEVKLSNSLESIGEEAFAYCRSLTNIEIPNSVRTIGRAAFIGCTSLQRIVTPDWLTYLGANAFQNCSSLTSIVIPGGVSNILGWTFNGCSSLEAIYIRTIVKTITTNAFSGCNSLTDVYYAGDESLWNDISIGSNNEPLTSATIHYNSTGLTPPELEMHSIYYVLAGGTGKIPAEEQHRVGEAVRITTEIPVQQGYKFRYWSDGVNHYSSSQIITMPDYDLLLIAVWEEVEEVRYSVNYDWNGGTGNGTVLVTYTAGETVKVSSSVPTRDGYTFAGWSDGTNTYTAGQTFIMPEHDVTLRAVWKAVPTDVIQKYIDFACSYNGMNGKQVNGWSSGWCASFITWCAGKVGLSDIIPYEPKCSNLFVNMIKDYNATGAYFGDYQGSAIVQGAKIRSKAEWIPQPGDLVFLDWHGGTTSNSFPFDHVGLVTGYNSDENKVYIVSGNATGGIVQWQNGEYPYWTVHDYDIVGYIRPNYESYVQKTRGSIIATIKCPVDVEISYDGETLSSAVGKLSTSFGTMTLNADESISVTLEYGFPYDISITGNGSGTMSMDVVYNLDSGKSEQHFVDVPISTATEISVITNRVDTTLLLSKNEQLVETWYASNGTTATKKDEDTFNELTAEGNQQNITQSSFTDVPANAYYADAVKWAVETEVTNGYPDGRFGPDDNCTRAQIVTFLWRAYGEQEPKSMVSPFTDVTNPNDYYYKAVLWAAEKKITTGATAATFDPNGACTRAEAVTFLYRAANKPAVAGGSTFTDVPANDWYTDAVKWAAENEIAKGSDGKFSPKAVCTRAHIVTFLYRDLA